jgi:hypothetical protein
MWTGALFRRVQKPTRSEVRLIEIMKKVLPGSVREALKRGAQRYAFEYAFHRIAAIAPDKIPSRELLEQLRTGWGNTGWSGRTVYLEEVVKWAAITPGPVLECGSGLTTILLGLYAGRRGVPVWTLEHAFDWHERITDVLCRNHISGVELHLSPLRDYGAYTWYSPPLEHMPKRFTLIVCDGPPEPTTPGKRYGLLPTMGDRLGSDSVILLDDADTGSANNILTRWSIERSVTNKILKSDESQSFALVFLD